MSATALWTIFAVAGLVLWTVILRKADWRAPRERPVRFRGEDILFAAGLVALFLYAIVISTNEPPQLSTEYFLNSLVFIGGEVAFILIFLLVRDIRPVAAFGLAPARPLRVMAFGAICMVATFPVVQALANIVQSLAGVTEGTDDLVQYLSGPNPAEAKALGVLIALVVAPLSEEVIFRGYLHGVMRQYFGWIASAITTSLIFAAVHDNLANFPALFVLGMGFAIAYELSGSLVASITMHVLFNTVTVIAVLFFPEAAS